MKRILCALLAGLMIFSAVVMISCEKEPAPIPDEQPADSTDPEPQPEEPPKDDGPTKEELEAMQLQYEIDHYNYIIGTQAFNPGYQFTDKSPLMELAKDEYL